MKICIIIRVYDRLEDLENCVKIIHSTWKLNDYYILLISNGKQNGYIVSDDLTKNVNKTIELEHNAGHMEGSSQLLMNSIKYIPEDCEYTVILEADTWVYGDQIVSKYINLMNNEKAVWTSARWYDKFYSLATDFAIIKTDFLFTNPLLFKFKDYAECHIANYLNKKNEKWILLKENMPTMIPGYLKSFFFTHQRRFNIFLKSKSVTHHVEYLKFGLEQKKKYFNLVSNTHFFDCDNFKFQKIRIFLIKLTIFIVHFFPRKSWFIKRYFLNEI